MHRRQALVYDERLHDRVAALDARWMLVALLFHLGNLSFRTLAWREGRRFTRRRFAAAARALVSAVAFLAVAVLLLAAPLTAIR